MYKWLIRKFGRRCDICGCESLFLHAKNVVEGEGTPYQLTYRNKWTRYKPSYMSEDEILFQRALGTLIVDVCPTCSWPRSDASV